MTSSSAEATSSTALTSSRSDDTALALRSPLNEMTKLRGRSPDCLASALSRFFSSFASFLRSSFFNTA